MCKEIFPVIKEITADLLEDYITNQNEREVIRRTKALIKNKKKGNITSETAKAIDNEESINTPKMISLIDDRTNIAIEKSTSKKEQANKRKQVKNKGTRNGKAETATPKSNTKASKKTLNTTPSLSTPSQ